MSYLFEPKLTIGHPTPKPLASLHCSRLLIFLSLICFCLTFPACAESESDHAKSDHGIHETGASTSPGSADSSQVEQDKATLTHIYNQAISEFIKAVYVKDTIRFDTLFFGKHVYGQPDDFPDIELPNTIEQTPVRLIAPELGQALMNKRPALVFVNLMGWVDTQQAEFVFVVFSKGGAHQYDYVMSFNSLAKTKHYTLDQIAFEDYRHAGSAKPQRKPLYRDGAYLMH